MTPQDIETLFTRSDGTYLCARWGRPIAPMVVGVQDETLAVIKVLDGLYRSHKVGREVSLR